SIFSVYFCIMNFTIYTVRAINVNDDRNRDFGMKKVFVKTNNVKRFIAMMNNLQNRAEGLPGMALVYGEPRLGKTQAINWWAFKNNAILIRCTQLIPTVFEPKNRFLKPHSKHKNSQTS
ncbi:MAG: hypothetical protein ACI4S3_06300, partial [Candidatus Gastranaerophilaceae bacterium]